MGNRQVASELFVSIKTVQFHLTHIYAKLGISTRTELAAHLRDKDTTDRARLRAGPRRQASHQSEGTDLYSAGSTSHPLGHRDIERSQLTPQESAVARLVAAGMGNRQVASELFVSIKTVQFHLTHIYAKLGISTRAELAAQLLDTDTTDRRMPAGGPMPDRAEKTGPIARCEGTPTFCESSATRSPTSSARSLTRQELAVARLVGLGMVNRQIAAELFVSITTVQFHLTHIYTKLGFGSRIELAAGFSDKYR